jgi:hypothetical protein
MFSGMKGMTQKHTDTRGNRRSSSDRWEFTLTEKLDDQPAGVWESLTGSGSIFIQEPLLRTVERVGPANLKPRYVTVLQAGRPIVAVAAQLIELSGEDLLSLIESLEVSPQPDRALRMAVSLFRDRGSRVLVCGSALSCGLHGVAMAEGVGTAVAWQAVGAALERIRRAEGLSGATDVALVKDVPPNLQPARDALTAAGYRPIANEPNMVLRLDPSWRTHQDCVSGMSSKYRRSNERTLGRVEESGYRIEPVEDVAGCAETLHRLYLHVQRRAKLRLFTLSPEFLPTLAAALGSKVRLLALRSAAGQLVGFVTVIHDGATAAGYFMGYDPEDNRSVPVYLRLLHAVVEEALRMGCDRVSFGRTALEPKARLGADPVALSLWVRHRQPSLYEAADRWLRSVLFERVPSRHPFG